MARKVTVVLDDETNRLFRVIRDLVATIPQRPLSEVDQEIADVRAARRAGGRNGRGSPL